jgi:predicted nucleic acid-binding protein
LARYRLYLDTSVFGALFDTEEPRRVALTSGLLKRLRHPSFDPFVGTPLYEEVARAPERIRGGLEIAIRRLRPVLLEEDEVSLSLADAYLGAGVVGVRHRDDARHLALASVAGVDTVVSWNFRHMVNLEKKRRVHSVNVRLGYPLIDIVSPLEVPDV